MSKLPLVARLILGVIFFVFGLNGFLNFLPMPPLNESAGAFLGALAATKYMFPIIKGIEVLVGILLLSNKFVPLALLLLAPITVNIVLFHGVLAPDGLAVPIVVLILHLFLANTYKSVFAPLLKA
jgi:uncharacterized membrane protein YphA (DoxX/SURF4 family)